MPATLKVLILSARAPVALDWARQVAAAGHTVYLADYGAGALGEHSALAADFFHIPPPAQAPETFIASLAALIEQHQLDWLIPTCEEIFCLAHYRHLLPTSCHIFCDDFDTLHLLHHKQRLPLQAALLGIDTPHSEYFYEQGLSDVWRSQKRVLKPVYSRFGHQTHIIAAHADWPAHIPRDGTWLQQAYITGREICSYSIAHTGRILTHVNYLGRYRYKNGASYYFEPLEHAHIQAQVAKLVQALNFTGQIAFDWIEEDLTGRLCVLECNPRATSGLHLLPHDGGVFQAILQQQPYQAPLKTKMFAAMMLSDGLKNAWQQGLLAAWWQDWRRGQDVLGQARLYRGVLQDSWAFYRLSQRLQLPLEAATCHAFAWNGQAWPELNDVNDILLFRDAPTC